MYDSIVTVFNYYESATERVWYPHVLSGVHLETNRGQIIKKYGPDSTDNAELYIHFSEKDGKRIITDSSGKELPWIPPKQWRKQVNESLPSSITFGSEDFFMEGAWEGSEKINDGDYADRNTGGFYAYMNKERDFVFKITSVGGPIKLIPHFEILGA